MRIATFYRALPLLSFAVLSSVLFILSRFQKSSNKTYFWPSYSNPTCRPCVHRYKIRVYIYTYARISLSPNLYRTFSTCPSVVSILPLTAQRICRSVCPTTRRPLPVRRSPISCPCTLLVRLLKTTERFGQNGFL